MADVRVTVRGTTTLPFPAAPKELEIRTVDAAGTTVSKFGPFRSAQGCGSLKAFYAPPV